jgi:hypothetical protein
MNVVPEQEWPCSPPGGYTADDGEVNLLVPCQADTALTAVGRQGQGR